MINKNNVTCLFYSTCQKPERKNKKKINYVFYYHRRMSGKTYKTPLGYFETCEYNSYNSDVDVFFKHLCYGTIEMNDKEGKGVIRLTVEKSPIASYNEFQIIKDIVKGIREREGLNNIKIRNVVHW